MSQHKESGNTEFKKGNLKEAITHYTAGIREASLAADDEKELLSILYSNRAACHLKLSANEKAANDCTKAIGANNTNAKAWFRRAQAHSALFEELGTAEGLPFLQKAVEDYGRFVQQQPENRAGVQKFAQTRERLNALVKTSASFEASLAQLLKGETSEKHLSAVLHRYMTVSVSRESIFSSGIVEMLIKHLVGGSTTFSEACGKALSHMLSNPPLGKTVSLEASQPVIDALTSMNVDKPNVQVIRVLSSIGAHHETPRKSVIGALLSRLEFSEQGDLTEPRITVITQALQAIARIAASSRSARADVRLVALPILLFSRIASPDAPKQIQEYVLTTLVAVCGPPHTNADLDEKAQKEEKEFKEALSRLIVIPLLSESQVSFAKSGRALSLVLQASPELGCFVVTHGKTKEGSAPPLQQLLFKVDATTNNKERMIAAEILTLASMNTHVRSTIAEGGQADLFFFLLDSPNAFVRSNAALALSKLVAVGNAKELRQQVLETGEVVDALCELMSLDEETASSDILRHVVESFAYLSLHVEVKKQLAAKENGVYLQRLFDLTSGDDRALRYGVTQIIGNLVTSGDDLKAEFDDEVEQLKKIAQKGLPNKENELDATERAGTGKEISIVRRLVVKQGGVRALDRVVTSSAADAALKQEEEEEKTGGKKNAANSQENVSPIEYRSSGITESLARTLSSSLVRLASEPSNRGLIVQQRGIRILLTLHSLTFPHAPARDAVRIKEDAAVAIARVGISTNPALYPDQTGFSMIPPLMSLLRTTEKELYKFEALMALTNLGSSGEDLRRKIILEKGWSEFQYCLSSPNDLVQRAAVQALTNLVLDGTVVEKIATSDSQHDVKLFVAFCGSEDMPTVEAALGALAMISHVPEIAKKIVAEEKAIPTFRAFAACEEPSLKQRADVIVRNLKDLSLM